MYRFSKGGCVSFSKRTVSEKSGVKGAQNYKTQNKPKKCKGKNKKSMFCGMRMNELPEHEKSFRDRNIRRES